MVEGIYLEEKCKFGGKSEVSLPLENTGRVHLSFGSCLQIEMTIAGGRSVFQETRSNQDISHLWQAGAVILPSSLPQLLPLKGHSLTRSCMRSGAREGQVP